MREITIDGFKFTLDRVPDAIRPEVIQALLKFEETTSVHDFVWALTLILRWTVKDVKPQIFPIEFEEDGSLTLATVQHLVDFVPHIRAELVSVAGGCL